MQTMSRMRHRFPSSTYSIEAHISRYLFVVVFFFEIVTIFSLISVVYVCNRIVFVDAALNFVKIHTSCTRRSLLCAREWFLPECNICSIMLPLTQILPMALHQTLVQWCERLCMYVIACRCCFCCRHFFPSLLTLDFATKTNVVC